MDYVEMIKDPELVLGFQELVSDSDAVVVKRTVKVFTSVYHHTLRLLSVSELDEDTVLKSWSSVNGVVDRLLRMIKNCENEGVLIHLLRFLESAVMSHLVYDMTSFPFVFERGREVIKTGLKALKDLITTPYIGGSSFNVGIRVLISIACLRPDLWEPVTDLIRKQLSSLPPTLFDHNVRSLNKTLQRNLFRLLRRAEKPELREKLIEMMVSVGVPRKMIAPWAPQIPGMRKRSPPVDDRSYIWNNLPPDKKSRLELENIEREKRSRSNTPEVPTDPRFQGSGSNTSEVPTDPRLAITSEDSVSPQVSTDKSNNADLLFLTSLIPTGIKSTNPISEDSIENKLYNLLNLENVCSLVIQNIEYLPDTEPKDFITTLKTLGSPSETEAMRKRLASIFYTYLNDHKNSSQTNDCRPISPHKLELTNTTLIQSHNENVTVTDSSSNSVTSTPSSTPPLADTDLRPVHPRTSLTIGDVDMRISDPRLANRDPRLLKDPRTRKDIVDPRSNYSQPQEIRVDPRLDRSNVEHKSRVDPRSIENNSRSDQRNIENNLRQDPRNIDSNLRQDPRNIENCSRQDPRNIDNGARLDPRLSSANSTRKTRWDPRSPQEAKPLSPVSNNEVPAQVIRNQGKGLLPHPDPRTFLRDMDPRIPFQNQDPRMLPSNFALQGPFPFGPTNNLNEFNFLSHLTMPANPIAMPPMINVPPPFGWDNKNIRNTNPSFLFAQTLASVQQGLIHPSIINL